MSITLRPEQRKAYRQIQTAFENNKRIINLISATGTGKSYVIEKIIEKNYWSNRTIIVANTKRLLAQWQEMNPCLMTMTYQSLKKLTPKVLKEIKLIVFDESHHVGAPTWGKKIKKSIMSFNGYVIACTATPIRNDDLDAREIFGGEIIEMMTQEKALKSNKFAPVRYINACYNNPDNLTSLHKCIVGKYHRVEFDLPKDISERKKLANLLFEIDKIYKDEKKNNVLAKTLHTYVGRGIKKTLVFCESIKTLDELVVYYKQTFPKAHIYSIHSGCTFEDNETQLKEFNNDKTKAFLISVNMISEGYHLPEIDSVVLMRKTGSAVLFSQQIGRVLNSFNLDSTKMILDLASVEFKVRIEKNRLRIHRDNLCLVNQLLLNFRKSKRVQIIMQVSDITQHITEIIKVIRERTLGYKHWTKEEDDYLKKNHDKMAGQEIADALGRTVCSVWKRTKILGLLLLKTIWTKEEDDYLKKNRDKMTYQKIADTLGKSKSAVQHRINVLGLVSINASPWTKKEDDYLKKNHDKMTGQEIADALGRTKSAVYDRISVLGLVSINVSPWTKKEDDYLKKNRGKMTYQEIANALGRTKSVVYDRTKILGLPLLKTIWTKEEDDYLKKNRGKMTKQEIADVLGKSKSAIVYRIKILGLPLLKTSPWTKEEDDYLKKNRDKMTYQKIADTLGKSIDTIRYRISVLGLSPLLKTSPWTKEEDDYLKKNYDKMTYQKIADALGKSKSAVYHKIRRLKLSKYQTKKKKNNKKKDNDKKNKRKKNKGQ